MPFRRLSVLDLESDTYLRLSLGEDSEFTVLHYRKLPRLSLSNCKMEQSQISA